MKNNTKFIIPMVITISMLGNITVLATEENKVKKDEIVYITLDKNGGTDGAYVVNSFNLDKGDEIIDYGNYSEVKNISTTDKIDYKEGKATTKTNVGKFYYEGELKDKNIPWNINVRYFLDGKEITGEQLAGKSGKLKIDLDIKKNENIKPVFFDNYALQIGVNLDTDLCENIVAEGGTLANVGSVKSISYIKFPKEEKLYSITADVKKFEMDPIQINGITMGMDVEIDGKDEMIDKMDKLSEGINSLNDGANKLKEGTSQYKEGVNELGNKTGELSKGIEGLNNGAVKVKEGISKAKEGTVNLDNGLNTLVNGSSEFKKGLDNYATTLNKLGAIADSFSAVIPAEQMAQIKSVIDGANKLSASYKEIDQGINESKAGAGVLNRAMGELETGALGVSNGASTLNGATGQLKSGANALSSGINSIDAGASSIKSGTGELSDKTGNMSGEVDKKINEMIKKYSNKDFKPTSFASEKNTNIGAVQFVIRTDNIAVKEEVKEVKAENKEESIFDRIKGIFKK